MGVLVKKPMCSSHRPILSTRVPFRGLRRNQTRSAPEAVDDTALAGIYAAADLYVDISSYEGFGLQVCEAMAFGVPVIASNIPALAELIGAAGDMVPRDDPEAIAAAMVRVLEDQEEWNERARLSRERARAFSWQQAAKRTLAIYQKVASQ